MTFTAFAFALLSLPISPRPAAVSLYIPSLSLSSFSNSARACVLKNFQNLELWPTSSYGGETPLPNARNQPRPETENFARQSPPHSSGQLHGCVTHGFKPSNPPGLVDLKLKGQVNVHLLPFLRSQSGTTRGGRVQGRNFKRGRTQYRSALRTHLFPQGQ